MKLAFSLYKYFPYGGAQRDFLRIARECRDRGHDIHVYTMSWEGEDEPGFHIHIIKSSGLQNHARMKSFIKKLQQALKDTPHDLVIGFNKMPGLDFYYAADVCYQKRAHEKHSWWYRLLPRYRQLVALESDVFAQGSKTKIMAISPFTQSEFSQFYQTEPERFELLPPGIALDRLAPTNAADIKARVRKQFKLQENDTLLLLVGSGFKTKGLDRAIHALAALPLELRQRCQLFVVGQDDERLFKRQATLYDVSQQVRFLGGRSDVADLLLAADLLVHPAYHENTGTVLLEALAAGLPVITTEVCGYAHYIKDAVAGMVLASPFDQAEFNATLEKAITSSEREQWGRNGHDFAKNADIYSMPKKAADLIEKCFLPQMDFDSMMQLGGENFRLQPGRQTLRVKLGEQYYFIKKHFGVGWREIFKNLVQLKKPVLGARNEKLAIEKLKSLGISVPNVMAYGERGNNPAHLQSYILLQELAPVVSLEQLAEGWRVHPPVVAFKRDLIKEVARIARIMHDNGVTHRDFYICHFLLDETSKMHLIDLHRAEIHEQLPERWRIKDLAGLYFSSINTGLTKRDYFRFIRAYRNMSLRMIFNNESKRWSNVRRRGERLYREHH